MLKKFVLRLVGVDLQFVKHHAVERFLADAFYNHEITISDYDFLIKKLNTKRSEWKGGKK